MEMNPEGAAGKLPLVSIVTPTRNQASFLPETIDSVRGQTYGRIEHIVVDGASTDETVDILKRYGSDYNLRWISEPDGGMYEALNKGLRMATGDLIGYLNSDDMLLPWAADTIVRAALAHPDCGLLFGDAARRYDELGEFDLLLNAPYRFPLISRTGSLVQPAVFWRRSLWTRLGDFDQSLRLSADLDYWLRANAATRVLQVEEVLCIERAHASGQTARLRQGLRDEATAVRGRFNRDRSFRLLKKVGARVVNGAMGRIQMLRFAAAVRRGNGPWLNFTRATRPRIRPGWFVAAMLTPRPLAGTPSRSVAMRLLRGRWLHLDAPAVVMGPLSPPISNP